MMMRDQRDDTRMLGRVGKSLFCIGAITMAVAEPSSDGPAFDVAAMRRAVMAEARAACLADLPRCAGVGRAAHGLVAPAKIMRVADEASPPLPPPRPSKN